MSAQFLHCPQGNVCCLGGLAQQALSFFSACFIFLFVIYLSAFCCSGFAANRTNTLTDSSSPATTLSVTTHSKPAPEQQSTFKILLFPFMYKTFTASWWKPIAEHIHNSSGVTVEPYIADNYHQFLKKGAVPEFDLFFLPDHMFNVFHQDYQLIPAAHIDLNPNIIFVTGAEKPARSLSELQGSCLSLPDPLSFTSMAAIQFLADQGLLANENFTPVYTVSHSDVILSVMRGDCPIGVMSEVILRQAAKNNRDILVLKKFAIDHAGVSFFINPRVKQQRKEALLKALFNFGKTPETRSLLKRALYFPITPLQTSDIEAIQRTSANYYPQLKPFIARGLDNGNSAP